MNKNKILETYMSWIVVLGQSMHFIQAWKIYYTKSAEDVSAIDSSIPYLLATYSINSNFSTNTPILIKL